VCSSDLDGPRDYATFSGSEKFRLSLALRIALAQCVARRTGTPIETVVVDEGFGNLDAASQTSATMTLEKLSHQGWDVFAVTHIPAIQETFPVTMEVSKRTGTSRVTIR
jgi:exonuclease SbcC